MKDIPVRKIRATQHEPVFPASFGIRDIQEVLAGRDMVQELHRHDFFFMLVLKRGKGSHVIDFTTYRIGDRSIFFMRPGQVHELMLKAGSQGYLMEFKTDFYYPFDKASHQLLRKASMMNLCTLDANAFKKLFSLLNFIYQEYHDQKEGYQEVIKANLNIFFIELIRNRKQRKVASTTVNPYEQERLDKLTELLEADISIHKEVSHYADRLHLSAYQLNAITKATVGKTCSQLINDYIILESKRYLLASSNQVNQIAYHLGYEDVSYFIRFFKKHTSYTPEAFRNNFK